MTVINNLPSQGIFKKKKKKKKKQQQQQQQMTLHKNPNDHQQPGNF